MKIILETGVAEFIINVQRQRHEQYGLVRSFISSRRNLSISFTIKRDWSDSPKSSQTCSISIFLDLQKRCLVAIGLGILVPNRTSSCSSYVAWHALVTNDGFARLCAVRRILFLTSAKEGMTWSIQTKVGLVVRSRERRRSSNNSALEHGSANAGI